MLLLTAHQNDVRTLKFLSIAFLAYLLLIAMLGFPKKEEWYCLPVLNRFLDEEVVWTVSGLFLFRRLCRKWQPPQQVARNAKSIENHTPSCSFVPALQRKREERGRKLEGGDLARLGPAFNCGLSLSAIELETNCQRMWVFFLMYNHYFNEIISSVKVGVLTAQSLSLFLKYIQATLKKASVNWKHLFHINLFETFFSYFSTKLS